MNQILNTNFEKDNNNNNNNNNDNDNYNYNELHQSSEKKVFKTQFIISIFAIFIIVSFFTFYYYNLLQKEKLSNNLIDKYEISKLYASSSQTTNESSLIAGLIEIPKLNISYPIFSKIDTELLKISPCIIYGIFPPAHSNLCIAGHNYNNDKFFSKINLLEYNDKINIYNNVGNKYSYNVLKNYEVKENDLSPILNFDEDSCILTLITCNNFNNNRVIIKAKLETLN